MLGAGALLWTALASVRSAPALLMGFVAFFISMSARMFAIACSNLSTPITRW